MDRPGRGRRRRGAPRGTASIHGRATPSLSVGASLPSASFGPPRRHPDRAGCRVSQRVARGIPSPGRGREPREWRHRLAETIARPEVACRRRDLRRHRQAAGHRGRLRRCAPDRDLRARGDLHGQLGQRDHRGGRGQSAAARHGRAAVSSGRTPFGLSAQYPSGRRLGGLPSGPGPVGGLGVLHGGTRALGPLPDPDGQGPRAAGRRPDLQSRARTRVFCRTESGPHAPAPPMDTPRRRRRGRPRPGAPADRRDRRGPGDRSRRLRGRRQHLPGRRGVLRGPDPRAG